MSVEHNFNSNQHWAVLTVGQDNLFGELAACQVEHVPTGRTITPFVPRAKLAKWRLPGIAWKILTAKYDLIVLPAVDFRWAHDASFKKRLLRGLATRILRSRWLSAPVNWLLARRGTKVIVLDRYDSHETLVDFIRAVTSAGFYFKTNLLESEQDRVLAVGRDAGCRCKFLPYWIAVENYQVPEAKPKLWDVFFAGAVNSPERVQSIAKLKQLRAAGLRVKIVEGHLPFQEYLETMASSWLTLSPQGYGYNGFRHYESMLVGSIPLINHSVPPIVSDLKHGENCFLYSLEGDNLVEVIQAALQDKERLKHIASGLREFVLQQHSMRGVGTYLLNETFGVDSGNESLVSSLTESVEEGDIQHAH